MEKQPRKPFIKKNKEPKSIVKETSSCCLPPVNKMACCTKVESDEKTKEACCVQPRDGSACCDK